MKRRAGTCWRSGIAAALMVLAAVHPAGATESRRIVMDMTGRAVDLPGSVTRVVGTGGAVDEWILLLGSPEKLVATSAAIKHNPWYVKIFPPILDVPTPISTGDVNIEALAARHPQAAIMLSGMTSIAKLERAGIPTVVLERRTPDELKQAVTIAAQVLGPREEEVAALFRAYYDDNIRRVTARTGSIPASRRTRVYYAGGSPLSTEGRDTIVTSWIAMAGGHNVADLPGVEGMGRKVSMEDVIAWNPEVVITMLPSVRDEILSSERWRNIAAVRDRRVYVNPKSVYSWGIRSADEAIQVLWAATAIHPELFQDVDMVEETKRFHKLFYHYDLTDLDARHILAAEPPQ